MEVYFVGKKRKDVWRVEPLCLFWTIWKARNKIAFEDAMLSIQKLKSFLCISSGPRLHYALKRALQRLLSSTLSLSLSHTHTHIGSSKLNLSSLLSL